MQILDYPNRFEEDLIALPDDMWLSIKPESLAQFEPL